MVSPRRNTVLLAGLLASALVTLMSLQGWLEPWELSVGDKLQNLAPKPTPVHPVVVVQIGDRTDQTWEEPTLLWTGRYAKLIEQAFKLGATNVGVDVIPVVNPDDYVNEKLMEDVAGYGAPFAEFATSIRNHLGHVALGKSMGSGGKMTLPYDSLRFNNEAGIGSVDFLPSKDLNLRLLPSAGSLSHVVASQALDKPVLSRTYTGLDRYMVFPQDAPPRVEAVDLESGKLTAAEQLMFKDATVVIGEATSRSTDIHSLSVWGDRPGLIAQAVAVQNWIEGWRRDRFKPEFETIISLVLGLCCTMILYVMPKRAPWLAPVLLGLWVAATVVALASGFWLPLVGPATAIVSTWLACLLTIRAAEAVEFALKEARMAPYVSKQIREYVDSLPFPPVDCVVTHDSTVMFFDLRGSTAYAQEKAPEVVFHNLNEVMSRLTQAVESRGGVLLKFLGDGFMAGFGVPHETPDHRRKAYECATAIKEIMEDFPFRFGVGIHTGEAAGGFLGSSGRYEFTVIGDAVNTAARLQDETKHLDTWLAISKDAMEGLERGSDLLGPREIILRGREGSLEVYTAKSE